MVINTSEQRQSVPAWSALLRQPALLLGFGFGSGLAPRAPGTAGTLLAMLLMPVLAWMTPWAYALFVLVAAVAGVAICGVASRRLGVHDHPGIVWDEFAGYWLSLLFMPPSWGWWLAAFALFRLFDIVKPWPIGWLDRRVRGGIGIMLDDLVAGLMTLAILQLLRALLP